MARGESRRKDVGLGAFDGIVLHAGVDGVQDVVSAEAERANIEGGIRNECEQMGGVLDSDGSGFVDSLTQFAPETVEHELGRGFATRIFGNAGNVQSDAFSCLVAKNLLAFLLESLTPVGPPG